MKQYLQVNWYDLCNCTMQEHNRAKKAPLNPLLHTITYVITYKAYLF